MTLCLVIASRGSQLALWQARWVERQLTAAGYECRIEIIKTTGDKITDVPLAKVGTKGLFTKEIEEALLDGRADLAVHSLKDLPTELPEGLVLAAVPEREDPRDAVVGRRLADLPPGARVGTSSLRRAAQLRKLRGDLTVESVRGNLDTRLRKLDEGQYDAILLAAAGLKRLGWGGRIAEILAPEVMCPAVGQGALAIETRAAGAGFDACAALDHPATHAAVAAERGLLAALGGGCQVPIGAHATVDGGRLRLEGIVASPDGVELVRGEGEGAVAEAEMIGRRLGAELLDRGARQILDVAQALVPAASRLIGTLGSPAQSASRGVGTRQTESLRYEANKVYLIGAGPGDPELITVKGRRILEQADVVFFDHLAPAALLDLAPPHAERIYAGKKKCAHAFPQEEVCAMLIERARRGLTVVRLKGGDPFIFGRGGEEAEALAEAGIPFEIVPGVTTPLGIAAYTGVPLTHREHTSVVTFVTGHAGGSIDWSKVGQAETLVIFMGLTTFPEIARELMARGRSPETPAMAVRWATRPCQETLVGTLATLPGLIAERGMKPPATIIVGEVVRLRDKLNWYERLPLFGKRIVVTRAKGQADALSARLAALGAAAIEIPTIEIRPAADYTALDRAIANLSSYDWLIFTSANGVRFFLERLDRSATDLRALRARICAIGPATRAAIEALHLKVDLMGKEYVAESLLEAFAPYDLAGKVVLLPRAAVARDLVPTELTRRGAHVDVVEAYRTVVPDEAARQAREVFGAAPKPDCITFTSSSTVENFVAAVGAETLAGVPVVSIGPVTTRTARGLGIQVMAEARVFTVDGLVEAVLGLYTKVTPPTTE